MPLILWYFGPKTLLFGSLDLRVVYLLTPLSFEVAPGFKNKTNMNMVCSPEGPYIQLLGNRDP